MELSKSHQGFNIAFIGIDDLAQTACAEYMKRHLNFKRMDLDDGLIHFLRTVYGYHQRIRVKRSKTREFYDALYKIDNNFWLTQFTRNFMNTELDVVVSNVRYMHEMEELQKLGFVICRVTSTPKNKKNIGLYVKSATDGTVALSMLYNKAFASNYKVDYSINFTNYPTLPDIIHPFLEDLGYKFDT